MTPMYVASNNMRSGFLLHIACDHLMPSLLRQQFSAVTLPISSRHEIV
jgi:hypothetical protein